MNPRLREAARTGDFNSFYSLIEANASVLKDIDTESFAETPLHVAASAGQIAFALEMMNLKPSFARTLNQAGFSPMHVALQNNQALVVHRLLEVDKDLVRVKGREGKTPLHYAAELGEEELLNDFLEACPECIEDVTVHGETALHIALKCNELREFESLVRWIRESRHKDAKRWEERVLNWKDEQGNTVLHIAAIRNQPEAVRLLVKYCDVVDVNIQNSDGLTALECCDENDEIADNQRQVQNRDIIDMLRDATRGMRRFMAILDMEEQSMFSDLQRTITCISRKRKNISKDMRNALLVVITLIITATYQSCLSPPGGVWQGDNSNSSFKSNDASINTSNSSTLDGKLHDPGTTVMPNSTFSVFWIYNTLTLLITLALTAYLLPGGSIAWLLLVPLTLLCSSYMLSMSILSPTPLWSKVNKILSVVFSVGFILLLLLLPNHRLFNEMLAAQMNPEALLAVLKSKKLYIDKFFLVVAALCFTVIMLQKWLHM